jgi:hypothetical protein
LGGWTLVCPAGGVYRGECQIREEDQKLVCGKLEKISQDEGCSGIVLNNQNPDSSEIPEYCEFEEEKVKPAEYFHPESFRTLCPECPEKRCALCPPELACATRIIIGCPKEHWDEKTKRCKVGTEAHVIYHGKPKEKEGSNPTSHCLACAIKHLGSSKVKLEEASSSDEPERLREKLREAFIQLNEVEQHLSEAPNHSEVKDYLVRVRRLRKMIEKEIYRREPQYKPEYLTEAENLIDLLNQKAIS